MSNHTRTDAPPVTPPEPSSGGQEKVTAPEEGVAASAHGGRFRILDMPALYYFILLAILLIASATDNLPDSMVVGFAATMILGGLLMWIGNLVPVVRDFGLPTVLCTFVPAILIFAGVMPENLITIVQNFVGGYGFIDFFVVTVIAGTILGMPRGLLIKAGPRFVVPVLGCLVATFALVGLIGQIIGYGFIEAVLFVAAPVMAGGIGIGALPMSGMYADATGGESADFMGDLMSAVVIANVVCILIAGLYNGIGKRRGQLFVGFNGHGQLLRIRGKASDLTIPAKKSVASFLSLGKGLAIAGALFILGNFIGAFTPAIHPYAWTILAAAAIKIVGLMPKELEEASSEWGDLIVTTMVPALLVGVSTTYIDIQQVVQSLTDPLFLVLTVVTVVIATLSSGIIGWLVGFNFVEASITPGLVMADTGGSGDVSVLSAAGRMHLMPFAGLTTRLGGAVVLFVTSLLVTFLD